jgi:hypothetical protein
MTDQLVYGRYLAMRMNWPNAQVLGNIEPGERQVRMAFASRIVTNG